MRPLNIGTALTPQQENPGQLSTGLPPSTLLESLRATTRDKPGTLSATGLATYIATGATHGNTTWAVVIIAIGMLTAETFQNIKVERNRA
ncbi:hypothetical protein [Streptomyces sp. NPDC057616]|uniref:hypothetical protein n=1 Tax=Streptomyces sp. NPDC057616 TaxID=3346183 RepID=UPI0036A3C3FB